MLNTTPAPDQPPSATLLPPDISRSKDGFAVRIMTVTLLGLVVIGVILRIWQYSANTSLWIDEIALAKGIVESELASLLTAPLPYSQVAPKGFLLLQKLTVMTLGESDYALRLVPLICSLIALVMFAWLAVRMLTGIAPVVAVLLFATGSPFIMFSLLAKQYATDICVAILLLWLTYELTSKPVTTSRTLWAAIFGAILIWFSIPALLLIAASGASLLIWRKFMDREGGSWRNIAIILALWGVSALAVALVGYASMSADTREYMQRYWAAGFPPGSRRQILTTLWPLNQINLLFGTGSDAGLAYPLPELYILLAAGGLILLWRQYHRAAMLITAPLIVTLGAAVIRQYPFSDRSILFLVPGAILAIAAAIEGLRRVAWPLSPPLATLLVIALVTPMVYPVASTPPVYRIEDMKPILAHVQRQWQPGDSVYVYYGAAPAVAFYAPAYGLERSAYRVGGCHRGNSRRYLQELDTFRGRSRVWIVLTHALSYYREQEDMLSYLDTIGSRKDSLIIPSRAVGVTPLPAEVYLYDLSDTGKAASGAAETFPLTSPKSAVTQFGCSEGPQVMIPPDFQ